MNYVEKDYEEIFGVMLEDSVENGLASRASDFESFIKNRQDISNYYVMDKAVIANMFRIVYAEGLTPVYESDDIDLAEGVDLDNIGDKVGIPRPEATHANVSVKFTLVGSSEEDISVEEGIIISTENGIEYETIEELYIPVDEVSATVSCRSVNPGSGSRVSANSLTNVDGVGYNLVCTNPKSSTGGTDAYDDFNYRELLGKWREILITGSTEAYEYYFTGVDGINGYKLIPNWDGTGTMKIIVDPGTPAVLNQIYYALQNQVSLSDEDIVLFAPTEKQIDISAEVNIDIDQINPYSELEKEEVKSRILSAIKVFIEEGYLRDGKTWYSGLDIGEDFIPHKLAVFLDEEIPELKNITFSYPTDYIEVEDDEICVCNNIDIEMI